MFLYNKVMHHLKANTVHRNKVKLDELSLGYFCDSREQTWQAKPKILKWNYRKYIVFQTAQHKILCETIKAGTHELRVSMAFILMK